MQLLTRSRATSGSFVVAGIDEAGRGPLAGPVTAACVCFPPKFKNKRITDSKRVTKDARDELFDEIRERALAYSIVSVGPRRIERYNILGATKLAMQFSAFRTMRLLEEKIGSFSIHFLIDGNAALETELSHETIVKGDQKILSISAASILAKVARDRLMARLEERYPRYGFVEHKGYGTELHREKIREHGPSRAHRRSFAGVAEYFSPSPGCQLGMFPSIVSGAAGDSGLELGSDSPGELDILGEDAW